jgi:hypothetical protein
MSMNHTHTRTRARTHTHTHTQGNPRIWNPTTVAIFGMIGTLPERNPITVCCTALHKPLSGLSCIVSCNCRDSDVGIIAEFRINYRTVPEPIRQRRFAFGKIWTQSGLNRQKTAMQNFSRSCPFHRTLTRQHRTLLRFWSDDIVTIIIRLDKIGWVSRMLRDASNFREYLADLSGPFPIRRTLLWTYTTAFRQW